MILSWILIVIAAVAMALFIRSKTPKAVVWQVILPVLTASMGVKQTTDVLEKEPG